jgi:hypothetical protein
MVLGLTGEHDYPVRPLPAQAAEALSVQRAQAVRSRFALDRDGEQAGVADICAPWTGCRWPSSWPRPGCGCCPLTTCAAASPSACPC